MSYFLNWLSERDMSPDNENRVFVMVTMNRTAGVPPELLRTGRFDRVWSTALPDDDERKQILEIHLNKRGVDPYRYSAATFKRLITATRRFTGAELEEVVISGRNNAYDDRMVAWEAAGQKETSRPDADASAPTIEELIASASEVTPIAKVDSKSILDIEEFCASNTYPVNGDRIQDAKKKREPRKVSTGRKPSKPAKAASN